MNAPLHLLWLVPALPLAGAVVIGLFQKWLPRKLVAVLAPATLGVAFVLALLLLPALTSEGPDVPEGRPDAAFAVGKVGEGFEQLLWTWIPAPEHASPGPQPLEVAFDLRWDGLSAIMCLTVTFVGFWIHLFSIGYMSHDPGFKKYFAYLNLFVAFMLVLVLGASLPVLFVGWEGVGLCSYLLIGFWYEEKWPQDAAVKAFVTNRIGDFAFLLGMLWIFSYFGTLHIASFSHAAANGHGFAGTAVALGIALLLFGGATGKSAQLPLYVWLPDAMAGPTPVSALIHAATMVTAGVYMVVRNAAVYLSSPQAMMVVAVIGAATALWAALFGLAARELKQVLAYSTVSQLGYMFLALGAGAFSAGIFHLVTHAFFKALLFLGAGAVMHACANVQELDRIGGLRKYMPQTHITFWAGALALAGIVPFAGFWSKDAILYGAWTSEGLGAGLGRALWLIGLVAASLTAFYTLRLVARTFWGEEKIPEGAHPHEQPPVMTIPLWVLAAGSVVAGALALPHAFHIGRPLDVLLGPVLSAAAGDHGAGHTAHHGAGEEIALMAVATAIAVLASGFAWWVFQVRKGAPAGRWATALPGAYRWLREAGYVDQALWGWLIYPYRRVCGWLDRFDALLIDGSIRLGSFGVEITGLCLRFAQTGHVRSYLFLIFGGTVLVILYCLYAI